MISNDAPDQLVSLDGLGDITVGGTYPDFSIQYVDPDKDPQNELQTLQLVGNTLSISSGNSITLPDVSGGVTYTAGQGIQINSQNEILNTAPDQLVTLQGQGAVSVSGTYPDFTITSTDPDEDPTNEFQRLTLEGTTLTISDGNSVVLPATGGGETYTAGTGIAIDANNAISNTAPDQEVTIGSLGDISVQGTYPNFVLNYTNPDPNTYQ